MHERTLGAATRERILTAAIDVMRAHGVGGATTRAIAAAAGTSEALLYRYFASKLDVLRTAVREYVSPAFNELLEALPGRVGAETPRAHLEAVAAAAIAYYRDLIPVVASLFGDAQLLGWYGATLRERQAGPQRAVRELGAYVRAEQHAGRMAAALEPDAAAQMLLGACFQHVFFSLTVGADRLAFDDATLARSVAGNLAGTP